MKPATAVVALTVLIFNQTIANSQMDNDEKDIKLKLYKNCDKKCLYDRVASGMYEDAAGVTRHLVSNNLEADVQEVVNSLIDSGIRNTISYAYKLWEMDHTIVIDHFPQIFKSLFTGNDVIIANSNYNVSMMVGINNDRVVATREHPSSYSGRWTLAPAWDNNHVYFRMTSAAPYVHLVMESDSGYGNRNYRVLTAESYTENSNALWGLEPLPGKRNTFYIINKRYGVALKTNTKDNLVSGHPGSPYNCKYHGWDILESNLRVHCDVERETSVLDTTAEAASTPITTTTLDDMPTPQTDTSTKFDITLFNAVMTANYETAIAATVKLDQSDRDRSTLRHTIVVLLSHRRNNIVTYGTMLWLAGKSSIVTDYFPAIIARIIVGDWVKIVHHHYTLPLKLDINTVSGDRQAWGSNIDVSERSQLWMLTPRLISKNSVAFLIKNVERHNMWLKVDREKSSSKKVWGDSHGVSLERKYFDLEVFDYYGTILFYIVNKQFNRALTLHHDVADGGDRAVVALEGFYDDPLTFGWLITA